MTSAVFTAFFLGQGGYLFSWGIKVIADKARAKGIGTQVYSYTDVERARADIRAVRGISRIALVGYSLGCTTATWLQSGAGGVEPDLVICIAESTLAENHPIDKATKRSVLFAGTDFLSSAGQHDGFDVVRYVDAPALPVFSHLSMPSLVTDDVLAELVRLKGN
jgi:pimeloyl-ACP methyl ester carboxylesterase